MMTADEIEHMFTRTNGEYLFARWGRPICPVVFGVTDETLSLVKGAVEAVCIACGHSVDELDPELGSNMMVFFFREWAELLAVKDLDKMIPELSPLVARLHDADANQYRIFRFDENGAIKACFVFLRMDTHMEAVSADTLALGQAVQSMLLWSETTFKEMSPLATVENGTTIVRPEIAAVLRAGYDPVMPVMDQDKSHALRMSARMGLMV